MSHGRVSKLHEKLSYFLVFWTFDVKSMKERSSQDLSQYINFLHRNLYFYTFTSKRFGRPMGGYLVVKSNHPCLRSGRLYILFGVNDMSYRNINFVNVVKNKRIY